MHKGRAEDDLTTYRPIAVVSIYVKILEKIVVTQLSNYLESIRLSHPHQGAYKHGKSTEDILLILLLLVWIKEMLYVLDMQHMQHILCSIYACGP